MSKAREIIDMHLDMEHARVSQLHAAQARQIERDAHMQLALADMTRLVSRLRSRLHTPDEIAAIRREERAILAVVLGADEATKTLARISAEVDAMSPAERDALMGREGTRP